MDKPRKWKNNLYVRYGENNVAVLEFEPTNAKIPYETFIKHIDMEEVAKALACSVDDIKVITKDEYLTLDLKEVVPAAV